MRFNKLVRKLLEAAADMPPSPPSIIQKSEDKLLTFDDIQKFIIKNEGYKNRVYNDSRGIPTVGIGFNLLRPDARKIIEENGLNYENVLKGDTILTDEQIKNIFISCIKIAYADVKKYIPNYDSLPKNIKLGLIDLSFNLGYNRLSKFEKTKNHILAKNFKNAAKELESSKWASQVGNRAKRVINLFLSA